MPCIEPFQVTFPAWYSTASVNINVCMGACTYGQHINSLQNQFQGPPNTIYFLECLNLWLSSCSKVEFAEQQHLTFDDMRGYSTPSDPNWYYQWPWVRVDTSVYWHTAYMSSPLPFSSIQVATHYKLTPQV